MTRARVVLALCTGASISVLLTILNATPLVLSIILLQLPGNLVAFLIWGHAAGIGMSSVVVITAINFVAYSLLAYVAAVVLDARKNRA
jgi:hypothetical protein